MIEELLPETVVAVDAFDDDLADTELFPEEERVIARSVDKRRHEFTAVRGCARRALSKLGVAPMPILPGEQGGPRWPAGIVGSMTHCAGYRAAAVAAADEMVTVGIDAEPNDGLPGGVLGDIAVPRELERLPALRVAVPGVHWDRLLFSAKESVYKAWFPLARRWLGFEDAELDLDPAGTFVARLLVPGPMAEGRPVTTFHGRWLVREGLIVTAIALPVRTAAPIVRRCSAPRPRPAAAAMS
jgi:4'-phosphopantetheinyl transferase EntD